jgi:hypothetical protein
VAQRILEIAQHSHRVVAVDADHWHSFMARFTGDTDAVFYLDPPFYHKAESTALTMLNIACSATP